MAREGVSSQWWIVSEKACACESACNSGFCLAFGEGLLGCFRGEAPAQGQGQGPQFPMGRPIHGSMAVQVQI